MIQIFRSKTNDEQIAADVRQAAKAFNSAINKAISAGMSVGTDLVASYGSKEYFINRTIDVTEIFRNKPEKF